MDDKDKRHLEELAAISLLWKLELERGFKPKLRHIFRQIARDAANVYRATNTIPVITTTFQPELTSILRHQYRKVADKFEAELVNRITDPKLLTALESENRLDHSIMNYINAQSQSQAQIILSTTQGDLQKVYIDTMQRIAVSGESPSKSEVAKEIEKEFEKTAEGRVETIAITETSTTAEKVKFSESLAVNNVAQLIYSPSQIHLLKGWGAILDNKTRIWHADADGQEVRIDKPYQVGGQLLMHPGDMTLGASLDNIINCRCSSHTRIVIH